MSKNTAEEVNSLTLDELLEIQKQRKVPSISQISLQVLLSYFEQYILPFKYIYTCRNKLTIEFTIKERELCHLLFGTIDKNFPHASKYKGELGYKNIKDGSLTLGNLPQQILKKAKSRIMFFIYLDVLLDNPRLIYFNPKIVDRGNFNIAHTQVDADFLFHKIIADYNIHFFIKNWKDDSIVSVSFFPDEKDGYVKNQVPMKIIDKKKIKI